MNAFGTFLQNLLFNRNRYRAHQDAVIISCFYNPQGNPYRVLAFQKWYRSIKHLPHRIVECLIGPNAKSQLPKSPYITQVRTDSLLWHKETLLNNVVRGLPKHFKYVFWVDADVIFINKDWLVEGVAALQTAKIIQPFEYCVHLKKNQLQPDFDLEPHRDNCYPQNPYYHHSMHSIAARHPQMWRSFCANHAISPASCDYTKTHNYDLHGHTGFAWGARREVLDACPLYEKCFVGGGDHIIAHAAAGHTPHPCIRAAFADNIESVEEWSSRFFEEVRGQIGYVRGDLYHIWHGDIAARNYFQAVKTFAGQSKEINDKDESGLYVAGDRNRFVKEHYARREARTLDDIGGDFDAADPEFLMDMGYNLADLISYMGRPTYSDPAEGQPALADQDTLPGRFFEVPEAPPVEPAPVPPAAFLGQPEAQEGPGQNHNHDGFNNDNGGFGSTFS